jgi:hypothetical protein
MFDKEMMERAIKQSKITLQIHLGTKHFTQTTVELQMRASNIYVKQLISKVLIGYIWVSLSTFRIQQN